MEEFWRNTILDNIPHGEDGSFQCEKEDAIKLCEILLKRGYAVCLTSGDFDENIYVHWLYAGETENLNFADYSNVVFTSPDYIEEYPQAFYEDIELEEKKYDEIQRVKNLEEENAKLKEELKELKKQDKKSK